MAFYTGKGDQGTTKLFDSPPGVRVTKTSPIFEALGMLDELNALTGWCKVAAAERYMLGDISFKQLLREVQDHLFTIQAEVAGAEKKVPAEHVTIMSERITAIEKSLPEVKSFLVAGGSEMSVRLDVARAVSRRVERRLIGLHESGERAVSESSRAYANRLSSLFYALERLANHIDEVPEEPPVYQA